MLEVLAASPAKTNVSQSRVSLRDLLFASVAVGVALLLFGFLFNRATVLSYSIGYNLYGAERVLAGEVPYRDFHTLYPPATLYLNAALFKLMGCTLYSAMFGVFVFKVMTILMIFLSGRRIVPGTWALAAALLSLFWLRPNGAFKAVPMQYGALFLALALFLLLDREGRQARLKAFLAGVALGLLTLFKHNIGAYAFIGCLGIAFLECNRLKPENNREGEDRRWFLIMICGLAAVILPVLVFMGGQGALGMMMRTLLVGSSEFLVDRLVIPGSPAVPIVFTGALVVSAFIAHKLRSRPAAAAVVWMSIIIAISAFTLGANEYAFNKLIFYLPVAIFTVAMFAALFNKRFAVSDRRALFTVLVFAAAAFVELFPRFAREQSIAAIPFVILVLLHMLFLASPALRKFTGGKLQARLAMAVLPVVFLLIGARLLFTTYFDGLRFTSDTELTVERARGVCFPRDVAEQIDRIVVYVQQRVPADGYVFAQSNGGSPYLFLTGRKNPSTVQFWGGVGVSPAERAATLEEIDRKQVNLIITSDEVMSNEKYEPLKEYINRTFKTATHFGDVLILER